MQAIKIEPGCKPELTEIPNTLRAFQQAAGGHIEAYTITRSDLPALVVILNEEGRLQPWEIKQLLAEVARLIKEVSDHDQG